MAGRFLAWFGLTALLCTGCTILPAEMNLGPLYRHRIDPGGEVASMDVLWPIFHYEKRPEGGWDFRVRPLFRKVKRPEAELYQFLWPLGRGREATDEKSLRLFPLFGWRSHLNEKGEQDVDWTLLTPLVWGGHGSGEDYFGLFPLYGEIPQFLSYDEAGWFLFPLYTWSTKGSQRTRSVVFPFFSHGWGTGEGDSWYWRFLPFYATSGGPGRFRHRSVLWPLVSWGRENLDGRDPRDYWFLFPLVGHKGSRSGEFSDWSALWPLFTCRRNDRESVEWDGPWPLFRYKDVKAPGGEGRLRQWWLTPLYGATDSEQHWARTVLWPLIRLRRFHEPLAETRYDAVLPLYWRNVIERADGGRSSWTVFWPFVGLEYEKPGRRITRIPDPIPFRGQTGAGWRELYDFLWNLYTRRQHGDRVSVNTPANLFCYDRLDGVTTWSIPLLGHLESGPGGQHTLRLLHLFPLSWGGDEPEDRSRKGE